MILLCIIYKKNYFLDFVKNTRKSVNIVLVQYQLKVI